MKKKAFITIVCVSLILSIALSFNASAAETSVTSTRQTDTTLLLQVETLLSNSTATEREKLLEKLSYADISYDNISNVLLSSREIGILEKKYLYPTLHRQTSAF